MPAKKKTTATKAKPKAAPRKAPARKAARAPQDLRPLLTTLAMNLAAEKGWPAVTLPALARAAKVSEAEVRAVFAAPVDILLHLLALADEANAEFEGEGSVRDNLFELTMQRFDALAPYRDGLAAIEAAKGEWPALSCRLLPALLRSSGQMLELAGVANSGPLSGVRQLAWLLVKADVARTWFADEGSDFAQTMAALDQRLGQLEKLAEFAAPWKA